MAAGGGRRRHGSLRRPCSWSAASSRPCHPTRHRLPEAASRSSAHSSDRPVTASCTLGGSAGKHTQHRLKICKHVAENPRHWDTLVVILLTVCIPRSDGGCDVCIIYCLRFQYLTSWWGACTVLSITGQNLSTLVDQSVSHCLSGVVEDATESCNTQKHTRQLWQPWGIYQLPGIDSKK